MSTNTKAKARNEDPLSGAPGAHPVGVGVGASGGGIAGGIIGMAAGPVGAAVGAGIGAVVGGLVGKSVAEEIDPTAEDAYWAANFGDEGYVDPAGTYNDYAPAYRVGYLGSDTGKHSTFDEAEPELQTQWDANKGQSNLSWEKARPASRAAWERVEKARQRREEEAEKDPLVTLENYRE